MDIQKKLELLADVMDLEVSELKLDATLKDLGWDSVATLSFIVMLDDEFKRPVDNEKIQTLVTVQDALDLMADRPETNG